MNKEIEALNDLFDLVTCQDSFEKGQKDYNVLEEALLELKEIKEANPSEALSLFEEMARHRIEYSEYLMPIKDMNEYKKIKQALVKAQEQKNVLDIINEKNVDIFWLKHSKTKSDYNSHVFISKDNELTQEEFDTLKRWL